MVARDHAGAPIARSVRLRMVGACGSGTFSAAYFCRVIFDPSELLQPGDFVVLQLHMQSEVWQQVPTHAPLIQRAVGREEEALDRAAPCEHVVRTRGLVVFGVRLAARDEEEADAWRLQARQAGKAAADAVPAVYRPAGYVLDDVDRGTSTAPASERAVGSWQCQC